jgi:hypothetical protein
MGVNQRFSDGKPKGKERLLPKYLFVVTLIEPDHPSNLPDFNPENPS